MTCYFQGEHRLHTHTFFALFIGLSPSLPISLCLVSFFLFFCIYSSHSLSIKSWWSLFSFPSFLSPPRPLAPSIHPPCCLTGCVCCFYPSDIGSLPRARPGERPVQPDGSPGSWPFMSLHVPLLNYNLSHTHTHTHTIEPVDKHTRKHTNIQS